MSNTMHQTQHNRNEVMSNILSLCPVIPVLVINDIETAVPLAQALVRGGLRVLEITLRTNVAMEAMRQIKHHVPEAIVGAGTVVNSGQIKELQELGVQFAVSPGLTPEFLKQADQYHLPLLPGVANASQIMLGMEYGYTNLKFFPASISGGAPAIKAFHGPFSDIVFCPTGGIGVNSFLDYLALPNVACVGGSWLAPKEVVSAGQWDEIEVLAKQALALSQNA